MTDLAAIRERDAAQWPLAGDDDGAADRRALLAYIDGLADAPAVDVERLAEVLRRHDCDNSTPTACAQVIAGEYGRLLAERDRLIGQGVDPADLDAPLPPGE